ncbi:hypothetical protein ACFU9Y_30120 [Streptomyces sp. NPDC057621]|uniref:hypothetical protein n=1 Tax=Streptomyces sp. NPDC057621 TaxID=3346186 RepID=UPI0036A5BF37
MSAPVSPQSRFGGARPAAVSVVSGGAVVGALTMANAPWNAVVWTVSATLVVSLVLGLAKIVVPDESEHRLKVILAFLRHLEHRDKRRERRAELRRLRRGQGDGSHQPEQRGRAAGGDRTLS